VTREDAIASIRPILQQYAAVRLGLLFGSFARGTANERSDVDIAIDVSCAWGSVDRLRIAAQLSTALGEEVDLVVLGDAGVPLLDEIVRDAVVAYEATPYAAARWRTHALIDLETDRPWYARMRDAWLASVAAQGLDDGKP
jgi:predicted nucleotidyltransferase